MEKEFKEILIDEDQIKNKVKELGQKITNDFRGKELVAICILKGAVVFFADLIREITIPLEIDFMAVSSYGTSSQSSGAVQILKDLDAGVEGKHLLIVEDIVDTGLTLNYLLGNLYSRKPASISTCAFLDKPDSRKVNVAIDYCAIEIPDVFVVGYGLDYAQKYRHLPYVAVLKT